MHIAAKSDRFAFVEKPYEEFVINKITDLLQLIYIQLKRKHSIILISNHNYMRIL
jgi:hypothetical protein